jgi:hypothetical protein
LFCHQGANIHLKKTFDFEGSRWKGIYYISICKSWSLINYGKNLPFWPFAWTWEEFETYSSCWILTLMFFLLAISPNCVLKIWFRCIQKDFSWKGGWNLSNLKKKNSKLQDFCDKFYHVVNNREGFFKKKFISSM